MYPVLHSRRPRPNVRHCGAFILAWAFLLTFPAGAVRVPLAPDAKKGVVHREIDRLEQKWRTAILSGNSADEATLLADSYVGIGPDGTISSKAEELQSRSNGRERLEKYDVEDRKVRIYGSTAVVTSKVRIQGVYSGQPLLGEYRYTRVWSLSHGQWRIVSFEANRVHDTSARRD